MRKYVGTLILAVAPPGISAGVEPTANVALTTDYVWRGISQTQTGPAVQGGFDIAHDSGIYAGVWASNVKLVDDDTADIEIDYYAGVGKDYDSGGYWGVNVVAYTFPRSDIESTTEASISLGYGVVRAAVHRDFDIESNYYRLALDFETETGVSITAHAGSHDFDEDTDYHDYRVAIGKQVFGLDLELAYTDTDLSEDACTDFAGSKDLCDGRFVFSVSRQM